MWRREKLLRSKRSKHLTVWNERKKKQLSKIVIPQFQLHFLINKKFLLPAYQIFPGLGANSHK